MIYEQETAMPGIEPKEKIKIRRWILFTEIGRNTIPYIIDTTKLDVSEEELALCIQEQVYGHNFNEKHICKECGYNAKEHEECYP